MAHVVGQQAALLLGYETRRVLIGTHAALRAVLEADHNKVRNLRPTAAPSPLGKRVAPRRPE